MEQHIAMGKDGVSVMLEKTSGVVKRIKDMTYIPVYATHCSAHRHTKMYIHTNAFLQFTY